MDGRVAFVTGAARGQGRAHAVKLAAEGADVVSTDLAGPVETVSYAAATADDLAETVNEVEALGRRAVAYPADVRDFPALREGLDAAVAELGGLDVVVANAGIINAVRPPRGCAGSPASRTTTRPSTVCSAWRGRWRTSSRRTGSG